MRKTNLERINRYRKAYPEDQRSNEDILAELESMRREKRYIDQWITERTKKDK